MNRGRATALLLSLAVIACIFTPPSLSAQHRAHVQTAPREYAEEHHDSSLPLLDMMRLNPQPMIHLQPWVRPEMPLPPASYPAHVIDPVLQSAMGGTSAPLAASLGLNFEGNDFDLTCDCAPPDTNGAVGTTQYVQRSE